MNELALFAGHGGGILGSQLLGHEIVCAVELDDYARRVLMARQDDGSLRPFPIWDDVTTFDGKPWRGLVDVVSGGFPCVGISPNRDNTIAGRVAGLHDPKSGLVRHQLRIIKEVEPAFARFENHPNLTKRGFDFILQELAKMGFDAEWDTLPADACGAPHERKRLWVEASHPDRALRQGGQLSRRANQEYANLGGCVWWKTEPRISRVDDGVAHRMDRLRGIGNGQVPIVAASAHQILTA